MCIPSPVRTFCGRKDILAGPYNFGGLFEIQDLVSKPGLALVRLGKTSCDG